MANPHTQYHMTFSLWIDHIGSIFPHHLEVSATFNSHSKLLRSLNTIKAAVSWTLCRRQKPARATLMPHLLLSCARNQLFHMTRQKNYANLGRENQRLAHPKYYLENLKSHYPRLVTQKLTLTHVI